MGLHLSEPRFEPSRFALPDFETAVDPAPIFDVDDVLVAARALANATRSTDFSQHLIDIRLMVGTIRSEAYADGLAAGREAFRKALLLKVGAQ